jgi:hypothetical protein
MKIHGWPSLDFAKAFNVVPRERLPSAKSELMAEEKQNSELDQKLAGREGTSVRPHNSKRTE